MDLAITHITPHCEAADQQWLAILDKAKQNDRRAQAQIYRKYHGKWLALCRRYFSNRDDALAVLNHGFLKIFKSLHQFKVNSSFDGWGYRIVQNTAIDHVRKQCNQPKHTKVEEVDYQVFVEPSIIHSLETEDIYKKLDVLPTMTRTVFILFAIEGFKHAEISEKLEMSVGTSKWHVNQARKKLSELIKRQ